MMVRALRSNRFQTIAMDEEFGDEATGINVTVVRNLVLWCVAAIVSWLLIEYVGFEPAMTVLLVATMLFVGVRNIPTIILTSVLMPIALSQAAWYFFSTELPGIWR